MLIGSFFFFKKYTLENIFLQIPMAVLGEMKAASASSTAAPGDPPPRSGGVRVQKARCHRLPSGRGETWGLKEWLSELFTL